MIDLSGRVFVITGGNGGIGLGMAEGIVMAGGSVVVWGRREEKNADAVATLEDLGGEAAAYVCDISDEAQVIETMARSRETFGRIDGLFANAGRNGPGTAFVDTSLEDWRAVMATNLDGVFLTLREAAKVLIDQGDGGSLVAVSSTSAIHGAAGNEAYGTAKTGLNGLVRALAVALAATGSGSTPYCRAGPSPSSPPAPMPATSSGMPPSNAPRSAAGPIPPNSKPSAPSSPTQARPSTPARKSASTADTPSSEPIAIS